MITIYDISKESGFAPGTVSKALNNYYGVNAETRKKIMDVAKQMGYTPNANARALKAKHSHNLGVLFYLRDSLDLCQHFFIQILNEFKQIAEGRGYDITLLSKGQDLGAQAFVKHCHIRQLDGVLIFGDYNSDLVQELMASDIPCVGFDYIGNLISGVTCDNYEKTKALVLKLIEMGHERILFLTGEDNYVTEERQRGYADAFRQMNIERLPCVRANYSDPESSYDMTLKLYPQYKPTAILYPDDYSAIGGINALRELRVSIPFEVSVASFDGSIFSQLTSPPLTCVCQDAKKIGVALAEKLIKIIEDEDTTKELITVESEIRFTDSCRSIK
ncbi:MAG: LacI family transcriptional regulator [Clostridiales bacterium]|nr:LacI family transcriptional regulator [Clostridiales bacterium]